MSIEDHKFIMRGAVRVLHRYIRTAPRIINFEQKLSVFLVDY